MHLAVREIPVLIACMPDAREPLRQWLRSIATAKGITLSEIAKGAEVAQSSITRFVNDPKYEYELSARTIRRIEEHYGVPVPRSRTFADAASAGFEPRRDATARRAEAFSSVMAADDALNLAGVRRGDLCEVDARATPNPGDLVAVEIRPGTRTRETIVRIYDMPYLTAHSTQYELNRPIMIEPGRARIVGVVVRIVRQLREPS